MIADDSLAKHDFPIISPEPEVKPEPAPAPALAPAPAPAPAHAPAPAFIQTPPIDGFCLECGTPLPVGAAFCPHCGSGVLKRNMLRQAPDNYAIASVICGIAGVFFRIPFSIVAIVLAHVSMRTYGKNNYNKAGRIIGWATIGIVAVVAIVTMVLGIISSVNAAEAVSNAFSYSGPVTTFH